MGSRRFIFSWLTWCPLIVAIRQIAEAEASRRHVDQLHLRSSDEFLRRETCGNSGT